ncbi:MAG: hypothetical protein IT556_11980 [Acetobacteraceae bacterium]|nr:hypothetical protein [Acetobacteraceae bacterium]
MKYPGAEHYNEAVQNPAVFFLDPIIRGGTVKTDGLGLPNVVSGGFAYTYRFGTRAGDIAVRCFHRDIPDLLERYRETGRFLKALNSTYFVAFEFLAKGVRIAGTVHPVVRMAWVEGETLLGFVQRCRHDKAAIGRLRRQIAEFAAGTEAHGFAHGDIQHRNLMVAHDGTLKLVDYDAMFVPALRHLTTADAGHPNFQPPSRTATDYGPRMDRFPLAVLDLGLKALQRAPDLWDRFHTGENLLLSRNDFLDPARSVALGEIARLADLRDRVALFRGMCGRRVVDMPTLAEFQTASGPTVVAPARGPAQPQRYVSQLDVVDGMRYATARAFLGKPIELVGQVLQVRSEPHLGIVLLRFGTRYHHTPTVVVPLDVFAAWPAANRFSGKPWISAIGILRSHRVGDYETIQVAIQEVADITFLSGKDEAQFRLGRSAPAPVAPPPRPAPPPSASPPRATPPKSAPAAPGRPAQQPPLPDWMRPPAGAVTRPAPASPWGQPGSRQPAPVARAPSTRQQAPSAPQSAQAGGSPWSCAAKLVATIAAVAAVLWLFRR